MVRTIRQYMQKLKLKKDLEFIAKFQDYVKVNGWRVVVYGGYGLDAFVGRITRDHRDLDLVVYGTSPHSTAINLISSFVNSIYPKIVVTHSQNLFQSIFDARGSGFFLNLYYIQTRDNPIINIHTIIKQDGEVVTNDKSIFPPPQQGSLEGLSLEVQDQHSHLKDILARGGASEEKYINDLALLDLYLKDR